MSKTAFFVSTLRITADYPDPEPRATARTVGFFFELEEAVKVLDGDYGDLNEGGYYPYAVIEELPDQLYPLKTGETHWFRYNGRFGDEGAGWISMHESDVPEIYRPKHRPHWARVG